MGQILGPGLRVRKRLAWLSIRIPPAFVLAFYLPNHSTWMRRGHYTSSWGTAGSPAPVTSPFLYPRWALLQEQRPSSPNIFNIARVPGSGSPWQGDSGRRTEGVRTNESQGTGGPRDSPRVFPARQLDSANKEARGSRLAQVMWQLPPRVDANGEAGRDTGGDGQGAGGGEQDAEDSEQEAEHAEIARPARRKGKKKGSPPPDPSVDPEPDGLPAGMKAFVIPEQFRLKDSSAWGIQEDPAQLAPVTDMPAKRLDAAVRLFKPGSGAIGKRLDYAVNWAKKRLGEHAANAMPDLTFAVRSCPFPPRAPSPPPPLYLPRAPPTPCRLTPLPPTSCRRHAHMKVS